MELQKLHTDMQNRWMMYLTPQDKQKLNPHITVQNKVTPAEAHDLYNGLSKKEFPEIIVAIGLSLWKYKGGPWEKISNYSFANDM